MKLTKKENTRKYLNALTLANRGIGSCVEATLNGVDRRVYMKIAVNDSGLWVNLSTGYYWNGQDIIDCNDPQSVVDVVIKEIIYEE